MPCYLSIVGAQNQKIEGSCSIKGHEGQVLVQAVDLQVEMPRNPQTGLASGKRIHHGMTITKEVDKSSPRLSEALWKGEKLDSVELDFFRITPKGTEEKYYTVTLNGATIVSAVLSVPNCLQPENKTLGHMETVVFTYEKIICKWINGNIQAEDSWNAPQA
jgi:type VI secretion system secreted protein Hcp